MQRGGRKTYKVEVLQNDTYIRKRCKNGTENRTAKTIITQK